MRSGRPRRRPLSHPATKIPHNMQTDNPRQPGEGTKGRVDTGFKTWDDFLANREQEGVTGEPSPNAPHMMALIGKTRDWISEGEDVEKDALFLVAKVKGGNREDKPALIMQMSINGSPDDLVSLFANAFISQPKLLDIASRAVRQAEANRVGDALQGLADFLKGKR